MKNIISIILVVLILFVGYYILKKQKIKVINLNSDWEFFKFSEFDTPALMPNDAEETTYTKNGHLYVKDSGKDNMSVAFIDMLENARERLEVYNKKNPLKRIVFIINSGFRSKHYNNSLKGSVLNSAHIDGQAADISTAGYSVAQKERMLDALYKAGFRRFGIMKNAIHVDNDASKPQNSVWNYDGGGYDLASLEIGDIKNLNIT